MISRVSNSDKDDGLDDLGWEKVDYYGEDMNEIDMDNALTEIYDEKK